MNKKLVEDFAERQAIEKRVETTGRVKLNAQNDALDIMRRSKVVSKDLIPIEVLTDLDELVIPDNIVEIKGNAFTPAKLNLKTLTFQSPNNLTIGKQAFANFSKLDTVFVYGDGESTMSTAHGVIAKNAFKNCKALRLFYTGKNHFQYIEDNAFENCTSLKEITISDSVSYIGDNAFKGCTQVRVIFSHWSRFVGMEKVSKAIIKQRLSTLGIPLSQIFFKDGILH